MPILLLFASLCLTTRYFTDKYTTLRLFTRPNYVNSSLNSETLLWLPTILYMHCLIAILQFSTPSIFPHHFEDQWEDGHFFTGDLVELRIKSKRFFIGVQPHVVFFIICLLVWLFGSMVVHCMKKYIHWFKSDCHTISMDLYR